MMFVLPFSATAEAPLGEAVSETHDGAGRVAAAARTFAEKHAPIFRADAEAKRAATMDAAAFFCGLIASQLSHPSEKIYCYSIFLGEVQDVVMDMKF